MIVANDFVQTFKHFVLILHDLRT